MNLKKHKKLTFFWNLTKYKFNLTYEGTMQTSFKPGSHCAITNRNSSFDAQIGPFSSATISNMFDIVALGDRNFKVVTSYRAVWTQLYNATIYLFRSFKKYEGIPIKFNVSYKNDFSPFQFIWWLIFTIFLFFYIHTMECKGAIPYCTNHLSCIDWWPLISKK